MNLKNNILSYIYDKDYALYNYENKVYIYKYNKLLSFNDNTFVILVIKKIIYVNGNNLKIKKLTQNELLIDGYITNIKLEDKNENKGSN